MVCASHSPGMDRDVQARQGLAFRASMARLRATVAAFDPQLVVLFGGDHRRAFRTVTPAFAVPLTASLLPEGGHEAKWLPVHSGLARSLIEDLLAADFDVAACRDVALDHAFGQPLRQVLGEEAAVPVLAIGVNCASPPLPSASRVIAFGRAVGRFLDGMDDRVLLVGTGGLSHSPPSLETDRHDLTEEERRALIAAGNPLAARKIRPEWDEAFLSAVTSWDEAELVALTARASEDGGVGANEVRTWLAAAAAAGMPLERAGYEAVEEWITGMGAVVSRQGVLTGGR